MEQIGIIYLFFVVPVKCIIVFFGLFLFHFFVIFISKKKTLIFDMLKK